jgi:hypothetical protein
MFTKAAASGTLLLSGVMQQYRNLSDISITHFSLITGKLLTL